MIDSHVKLDAELNGAESLWEILIVSEIIAICKLFFHLFSHQIMKGIQMSSTYILMITWMNLDMKDGHLL